MMTLNFRKTTLALSLSFGLASSALAGGLDGGTAPLGSDVAVNGSITATGGSNTVVGSGASISYPSAPATGWSNTAVGSGATINGANNSSLGADSSTIGGGNVTIGNQATTGNSVNSSGNIAIGMQSTAINNTNGTGEEGAVAIGYQSSATGKNAVAIGSGSVATTANSVSFGGGAQTPTRVLQNVTAGALATDAVNVSQMQTYVAANGGTDNVARTTANTALTAVNTLTPRVTTLETTVQQLQQDVAAINPVAILNQANSHTDQAINGLRKEYSRAIAAVAASPALPALAPGERAIAVGTGYYNGQGGLGIAFAQALQSGAIINAGVATTGSGGKPVLRAGAAWKF